MKHAGSSHYCDELLLWLDVHRVIEHIIARRVIGRAVVDFGCERGSGCNMVRTRRPITERSIGCLTLLPIGRRVIDLHIRYRYILAIQRKLHLDALQVGVQYILSRCTPAITPDYLVRGRQRNGIG